MEEGEKDEGGLNEFELKLRPERQDDSHEVLSENLLGPPLGEHLLFV